MPSFYTVVRYVPDPVTEERMNIGLVACSDQEVQFKFVNDWSRAHAFSGKDITFIKDFVAEFSRKRWDEQSIREMIPKWNRNIQFSEARASLKPVANLLSSVAPRFLKEKEVKRVARQIVRTKATAARIGYRIIKLATAECVGRAAASALVKKGHFLEGDEKGHLFDVVVQNGNPYLGIEALSFENTDRERVERELDAAVYAVEDVKKKNRKMQIGVLCLPPPEPTTSYKDARRIFKGLSVPLLTDEEAPSWAEETISALHLTA